MKKIVLIISVLFAAGMMTSCVKPYENEISLSLNNYDLTLPRTISINADFGLNGEFYHYVQVTATGPWEMLLETESGTNTDSELEMGQEIWCWFHDSYHVAKKDASGSKIMDENGYYLYDEVKVVEGVEYFKGSTTKWCKVRGNAGITYVPMEYNENKGVKRYARIYLRRTDTGEYRVMNITQNS